MNSSSQVGGAELSLLPVVRELRREHAVAAFLPGPGPLSELLRQLDVEVVAGFELPEALARASRHYGTRAVPRVVAAVAVHQLRFARALARRGPAVVYCNGFRAQLGATPAAAAFRVPTVWHVRDFMPAGAPGRAFALLASRAAAIVANSKAVAAQPALDRVAVRTIENGVDLGRFRARRKEPSGPPIVGMVGHLTPWKGHERFLNVLERVREDFADVIGRIAGAAIYDTAEHPDYVRRLALRVEALGPGVCSLEVVPPERMSGWLAELTVLVHCPDRPEPFGRSLAEALATGVPVVATAAGGVGEVLGEAGLLVPPGADELLALGVIRVLGDSDLRSNLAAVGVVRAAARFDERRYARETADTILATARFSRRAMGPAD